MKSDIEIALEIALEIARVNSTLKNQKMFKKRE
jgi:hypothetical protein